MTPQRAPMPATFTVALTRPRPRCHDGGGRGTECDLMGTREIGELSYSLRFKVFRFENRPEDLKWPSLLRAP